jgi:hypothetical protein
VVGRPSAAGYAIPAALTMPNRTRQPAIDEVARRENLEAQRTLLLLNEQADSMRVELAQLRQKLTDVQQEMTAERSIQLREPTRN